MRCSPKAPGDPAIQRALRDLGWGRCEAAVMQRFGGRLLGFITRRPLTAEGRATVLVFPRCRSVHTWFMRFPLDIAFADAQGRVLALEGDVAPWRVLSCAEADFALERPARSHPA